MSSQPRGPRLAAFLGEWTMEVTFPGAEPADVGAG